MLHAYERIFACSTLDKNKHTPNSVVLVNYNFKLNFFVKLGTVTKISKNIQEETVTILKLKTAKFQ